MATLFITATGTDVGKTFVSAGIVHALKQYQSNIAYYKPVESGGIPQDGKFTSGDGQWVSDTTSLESIYNTYCFEKPMSPHIAAQLDKQVIEPHRIMKKYKSLVKKYDHVVVEGAGGLSVPLIDYKYMVYDLISDLNCELLIVADAGLGSINHTTLTVALADQLDLKVKGIVLNQYNDSMIHRENVKAIEAITGKTVIAKIPTMKSEEFHAYFKSDFPIEKLFDI